MVEIDLAFLERLSQERRFEARTLEIAKRLFIYQEPPKRLAVEYGVNLARVYAIRNQVRQVAQEQQLPEGWVEVTLAGPADVIDRLRQQLESELLSRGRGRQTPDR